MHSLQVVTLITEHAPQPTNDKLHCLCLSHSGFLDKNNDLLNRNLKEVSIMKIDMVGPHYNLYLFG